MMISIEKTLWSPWFIQKDLSAVRAKCMSQVYKHLYTVVIITLYTVHPSPDMRRVFTDQQTQDVDLMLF